MSQQNTIKEKVKEIPQQKQSFSKPHGKLQNHLHGTSQSICNSDLQKSVSNTYHHNYQHNHQRIRQPCSVEYVPRYETIIEDCYCFEPKVVGYQVVSVNQRNLPEQIISVKEYKGQTRELPIKQQIEKPQTRKQQIVYQQPQQLQQKQVKIQKQQKSLKHYKHDQDFQKYLIPETYTKSNMFKIPISASHKSYYEEQKSYKPQSNQFTVQIENLNQSRNEHNHHFTGLASQQIQSEGLQSFNIGNKSNYLANQSYQYSRQGTSGYRCIC